MSRDEDFRVRTPTSPGTIAPLPPPPGSGHPPPRRRPWPWLITILVVLVVAAGTLTGLLIARHRTSSSTPPGSQPTGSASATAPSSSAASSGSASPSTSASQPPELLPRGQEAPASAIPWSQVDAGWNLRAWTASSSPNALTSSTLYLLNPVGGRYRITTLVPTTAVVAWSPDHRRAITQSYDSSRRVVVQEIELSTGRRLSSFALGSFLVRGYAGPGGHSLLLSYGGGRQGPTVLERVSTSGVHQLTYPASEQLTGDSSPGTALYSADGSVFLITGQRGFAVYSNDGPLLRHINFPASSICYAGHWWSDQVALGTCRSRPTAGSSVYGPSNLVLISIDSGRIRQITQAPPPEYGYSTAWLFSGGIVAQRATSCGPGSLDTFDTNGTTHPYSYRLPAGASGQAALVKVFADQATLFTGTCGSNSRSVIGLNLRTGIATVLLGPGLNGGTVLGG